MTSLLKKAVAAVACCIALNSCSDRSIRLVYWNIQNGMWADQPQNFDNFVNWVKGFDPDVCVWCEAQCIYRENSCEHDPDARRILPDGWDSLVLRYGHRYTAIGGVCSEYPQVITSKYPIETVAKFTSADIDGGHLCHGSSIQRLVIRGKEIDFVPLHLAPFRNRENFRNQEMNWILDHTVLDSSYSEVRNWIMLGDFNSLSPADNFHYGFPEDTVAFATQKTMLERSGLVDILREAMPENWIPTCTETRRLDYVYASPGIRVEALDVPGDFWCELQPSEEVPYFWRPSDHRPYIVDFKVK